MLADDDSDSYGVLQRSGDLIGAIEREDFETLWDDFGAVLVKKF